jgi:hypothetical protein
MNRLFFVLFSLCFFLTQGVAAELETRNDLRLLDQLIAASEKSLQKQKELKTLLVKYKQAEQAAIKNHDDDKSVAALVLLAKQVYDAIKDAYLEDYFSAQFMEEITTLALIGEKKQIPSPK